MTRRTDDRAANLREHLSPAGQAIVPDKPADWRDRWSDVNCRGELRSLYARETIAQPKPAGAPSWQREPAGKIAWKRVGYICLRCGVVELHADALPYDEPRGSWYAGSGRERPRRPGAVLVPGGSPAAEPIGERVPCPECGELQSATNLARHRRRRHSASTETVDTPAAAAAGSR